MNALILLVAPLLGGAEPVAGQQASGPYQPMTPLWHDPSAGGVRVRVGNGFEDEFGRRAFLTNAYGTIEVAAQYQVKLRNQYGPDGKVVAPGGEIYRLVVQAVRVPLGDNGRWSFDFELPFEPFAVRAGEHVNEVVAVKIPRPPAADGGAVRIVVEELQANGEWESRSVSTVLLMPL